jgi:hypothetical protein
MARARSSLHRANKACIALNRPRRVNPSGRSAQKGLNRLLSSSSRSCHADEMASCILECGTTTVSHSCMVGGVDNLVSANANANANAFKSETSQGCSK